MTRLCILINNVKTTMNFKEQPRLHIEHIEVNK